MKRLLVFFALVLSVVSVTGCSGGQGSAPVTPPSSPSTPTAAKTPDFTFTVSPTATTCQGSIALAPTCKAGVVTVTGTAVNGFDADVNVTYSALPAGVTFSCCEQNVLTVSPSGPVGSTFQVYASAEALPGTYNVTATATSTNLESDGETPTAQPVIVHTAKLQISVEGTPVPPVKPDFSVNWSPASVSIVAGQGGPFTNNETLSLEPLNGFSDPLVVSTADGVPPGMTIYTGSVVGQSFEWSSGLPLPMSIYADASTVNGVYPITFAVNDQHVVPELSHTATVTVTVTGGVPPTPMGSDFSLTLSSSVMIPCNSTACLQSTIPQVTVCNGAQSTTCPAGVLTITATAINTEGSTVTLSVSPGFAALGAMFSAPLGNLTPNTYSPSEETLQITASSSAYYSAGALVTVTGTNGQFTHSATFNLVVNPAPLSGSLKQGIGQ